MKLKIVATFNGNGIFTGITQIPEEEKVIDGQTDILPKTEYENFFTGTEWIHKDVPTGEQQLAMQQQMEIMKLKGLVMKQQTELINLKKEVHG